MPINASGTAEAPLTVFGSYVSDVSPDAVPENVSPANQDVIYGPGYVASRPALQKINGITFPAVGGITPTAVYGKSFVTPSGDVKNLYFDSAGRLWVEDFTNNPGVITLLLTSAAGSYCRSITKFGREYIAISDGLHGTEIPLQYDGTNLDRLTQDAPAMPPAVTSVTLPSVSMATSGAPVTTSITSAATINPVVIGQPPNQTTIYTGVELVVTSTAGFVAGGEPCSISGNSQSLLNGNYIVYQIVDSTHILLTPISAFTSNLSGTGGTLTATPNTTLIRSNNVVSATTSAAHNLQVGYLAQITGMTAFGVGSISSIVINNEDNPGIATVTTSAAHGLSPELDVTITGVNPASVGSLTGAQWSAGQTTLTFGSAHGLVPGAVIVVASVTTTTGSTTFSFDGNFTVALVPSPTTLQYAQVPITATDPDVIVGTGGSVNISWPIPDDTPTPTYFEVLTCPTPTTFTVQVIYQDGTWGSGTVGFAWDGIFRVVAVPSTTTFQYQQYGPNATTTQVGTVTPYGQMAPGLHLCQLLFLDRQGGITAPSPPVSFISNGQQYVSVQNITHGPPNIVARILAFTGAQPDVPGELPPFFYIPVPAQLEGQTVSTSTVVNDNTSTNTFLDFSDNTLYAALAISIPGNNLANQIILDGALGFRTYLDRLETFGQRNIVQNFDNMGFNGGFPFVANGPPPGWSGAANLGTLPTGYYPPGWAWRFITNGTISQSAYLDAYGDPIIQANQFYSVRVRLYGYNLQSNTSITFALTSSSTSYSSTATFTGSQIPAGIAGTLPNSIGGGYVTAALSLETPSTIPPDLIFSITTANFGVSSEIALQETEVFYTQNPYLDNIINTSYVNNPAGMDGDTGQWGPDDTAKVMDLATVRGTQCIVTQAPTGKLHETTGSAVTEPSGWTVNPIRGQCGALSAFCLTTSQADDATEAGGEDWIAWSSDVGAMIYGGGMPIKISQEIQPNWQSSIAPAVGNQINLAASLSAWTVNDPIDRLIYFGLPTGSATAPNQIYVLNYQHLGSAQAIADSPPFHPSFAGKLIATDNSRKWSPWNMTMNGAARMYRGSGDLTMCFFGGNGQKVGTGPGFGNIYTLNPAKFTDDDYGQIFPYYTTHFFLDPERKTALGLKGGRILAAYVLAQIQPKGTDTNSEVVLTYYGDNLNNAWPLTTTRTLTTPFWKDRNFGGGMAQGERIAIRIASSPVTGTDNSFIMTRMSAFFRNARIIVSGVNQ